MPDSPPELPAPLVESRILLIRGHKVLLDRDLAQLYQVRPIALRQQVRRNPKRFPPDFLFELTGEEVGALLSQNVIPSRRSLGGKAPKRTWMPGSKRRAWPTGPSSPCSGPSGGMAC
jgi:hypothetical protein